MSFFKNLWKRFFGSKEEKKRLKEKRKEKDALAKINKKVDSILSPETKALLGLFVKLKLTEKSGMNFMDVDLTNTDAMVNSVGRAVVLDKTGVDLAEDADPADAVRALASKKLMDKHGIDITGVNDPKDLIVAVANKHLQAELNKTVDKMKLDKQAKK